MTICKECYVPMIEVMSFMKDKREKFCRCPKCYYETKHRKLRDDELNGELSNVDLKLQDILHNIENTEKCDMYSAWQTMNEIRKLRKERRQIKDEKLILSGIKTQGITYLSRSSIQKCVDGLSKRKYRIRIVEEDEEE